jgi:hypothetical protein
MVKRIAEDFSGLLALSNVNEKGSKLNITVNHPQLGNVQVEVTNSPDNLKAVKKSGWKVDYDSKVFSPDRCPPENAG